MKIISLIISSLLLTPQVSAGEFQPTLLKIHADESVMYEFRGKTLELPVTVEGTPAGLIFSLFTRENSNGIRDIRNGYLGWHYMNKIDTCIYFSPLKSVQPGENVIVWDGRDQDGEIVRWGSYTYYIWAFDNQGSKQLVSKHFKADKPWDYGTSILSLDRNGNPLANPLIYSATERWTIGGDPEDETNLKRTSITLADGWRYRGDSLITYDHYHMGQSVLYEGCIVNVTDGDRGSLLKYNFVPGGEAEIVNDWGEQAPYGTFYPASGGVSAGVTGDGTYLYTAEADTSLVNGAVMFYIYDTDGYMVTEADLSSWWSVPFSDGQTKPAGPLAFESNGSRLFLYSHMSCLRQMIDPQRYLDSWDHDSDGCDISELLLWSNGNGDYTLDKNFEETAVQSWICNDPGSPGYSYSAGIDRYGFIINSAYDYGGVSFGLLGPDGTGLGFYCFGGETAGLKTGQKIIDSGTPYDGIYCDNAQSHGIVCCNDCEIPRDSNFYYIAHDSIKGVIWDTAHCYPVTVALISPAGGEVYQADSSVDIVWDYYFLQGHTYGCDPYTLTLEYSIDSGANWERLATGVDRFAKSYTWTVPDIETKTCLLRIMSGSTYAKMDVIESPFSITRDVSVSDTVPAVFSLSRNYPNPFNPVTTIPFSLGKDSSVSLAVYNTAGEKVATLAEGAFRAGEHSVTWDASGFASGVYFVRMEAGDFAGTRKIMLVK